MCQSTLIVDGKVVVDNVTGMELTPDGVKVHVLFEEPREIRGTLKNVDFLKHNIYVESTAKH